MPQIESLYRYPVKGMSPERLDRAHLEPGAVMPWDRAFAIENGTRDVDVDAPRYFPKTKFLMLMRDERLATLQTLFDDSTQTLTIRRNGKDVARGRLTDAIGRQLIEQFLSAYMKDALRGPPRIVHAPNHSFSDVADKVLSILNLASVAELERVVGKPVDPLRFRANVHLTGLEPWAEKAWVGSMLRLGGATLRVTKSIVRCPATNVNPTTAERDMNLPRTLEQAFEANLMGVYAKVVSKGEIKRGDEAVIGDFVG